MRFKLFKTDIVYSFPAVAFTTLIVLLDSKHTAELCILAAILHECGHLFAMLCCKRRPEKVVIRLFSVDISDPLRGKGNLFSELWIIYGGIIANAVTALCSFAAFKITKTEWFIGLAAANIAIGLFNLMPAATLDGGQGIFLIIMRRFSYHAAETTLNILTFFALIPFTAAGFLLLFQSKYNFSLLVISVYLILSLVLRTEKY